MSRVWLSLFHHDLCRLTIYVLFDTKINKVFCQKLNFQFDDLPHSQTIQAQAVWTFGSVDTIQRWQRLLPQTRFETHQEQEQALARLTGHTTHPLETGRTATTNSNN